MGAQDYHQRALPTHVAFSSLAFRVVSPHLQTQESITRSFEGLVGTWLGLLARKADRDVGTRVRKKVTETGSRLLTHGAGAGCHQAPSPWMCDSGNPSS